MEVTDRTEQFNRTILFQSV